MTEEKKDITFEELVGNIPIMLNYAAEELNHCINLFKYKSTAAIESKKLSLFKAMAQTHRDAIHNVFDIVDELEVPQEDISEYIDEDYVKNPSSQKLEGVPNNVNKPIVSSDDEEDIVDDAEIEAETDIEAVETDDDNSVVNETAALENILKEGE